MKSQSAWRSATPRASAGTCTSSRTVQRQPGQVAGPPASGCPPRASGAASAIWPADRGRCRQRLPGAGREQQADVDPGGVGVLGLQQVQHRRRRPRVEELLPQPELERAPGACTSSAGAAAAAARRGRPPGRPGCRTTAPGRCVKPPGSRMHARRRRPRRSAGRWSSGGRTGRASASRKVSASGPAGPGERSGGSQPLTNRPVGRPRAPPGRRRPGSAGASQITPRRSRTPARRRIGRPAPVPRGAASRCGRAAGPAASHPGAARRRQRHRVPGVLERGVEVVEHRAGGAGAARAPAPGRAGRRPGGRPSSVRSGASHTQPCRSSTAQGTGRSARGGGVPSAPEGGDRRRSGPRRRSASRGPGTAGGRRSTVAVASGTSRCGQRAGKALTSPPGRSRTTTKARPPAPTGTGVVPTSAARATGNQPVDARSHGPLQRAAFSRRYGRRKVVRQPEVDSVSGWRLGPEGDQAEVVGERAGREVGDGGDQGVEHDGERLAPVHSRQDPAGALLAEQLAGGATGSRLRWAALR